MNTITEPRESRETPTAKRPLANLQAKIDEPLFDRVKVLAARQRRHPRDVVEDALVEYLPKAERKAEKLALQRERG